MDILTTIVSKLLEKQLEYVNKTVDAINKRDDTSNANANAYINSTRFINYFVGFCWSIDQDDRDDFEKLHVVMYDFVDTTLTNETKEENKRIYSNCWIEIEKILIEEKKKLVIQIEENSMLKNSWKDFLSIRKLISS